MAEFPPDPLGTLGMPLLVPGTEKGFFIIPRRTEALRFGTKYDSLMDHGPVRE